MITDVDGVVVGHWTDRDAQTGCTVAIFPEGTVASGEVRGGAPATREFALLDPSRHVQRLDAVVLSGGSAFGLAAADGVMRALEARGQGYDTAGGVVPIVVGLSLYDLATGDGSVRPDAAAGAAAVGAAAGGPVELGLVGAGTGATIDKWRSLDDRRPGGLVGSTLRHGDLVVSALVAVNAFGEPGADASTVASQHGHETFGSADDGEANTVIGIVATNGRIDKNGCFLVAQSAHDGLARAVAPSHTLVDGDAFVVAATQQVDAEIGRVRTMAVAVVETAILTLRRA